MENNIKLLIFTEFLKKQNLLKPYSEAIEWAYHSTIEIVVSNVNPYLYMSGTFCWIEFNAKYNYDINWNHYSNCWSKLCNILPF